MAVNWTNITTPSDLLAIANTNSSGTFWTVTLWLIWVVVLLASSVFNFEIALLLSSFFGMIAGLLLVNAGLVAWPTVLFFIGQLVFTILYIVWSSNKDQT